MEETKSKFRRICVFCGSSSGNKTTYHDAALQLAHQLVERNIDLVYGGGSVGLMGLISQAVHDGGRHEYVPKHDDFVSKMVWDDISDAATSEGDSC
ncbi:hypothetical protein DY000_02001926 [Brassica cretica]|uniref:Cytokinin riboside 5'-monophosphate phosphoribohydrolase n=1 Tax=Brassica cretica TaxID=69181 RepID=A0ABQ7BU73_BRACR|nr:hypothetical protein DY000_02001926 [Brassica cretica]